MKKAEFEHGSHGIFSCIRDYRVILENNMITVIEGESVKTKERVEGLSKWLEQTNELKIGWKKIQDFEVIHIYDHEDNDYGYAVNLKHTDLSEWGIFSRSEEQKRLKF